MNITSEIMTGSQDKGRLSVNTNFASLLEYNGITSARQLWELESDVVKNAVKTRGTSRAFLKSPDGGSNVEVYIKRYLKPSLKDRLKCATSFKPVFMNGALHEWDALCRFHELGLNTMIPIAVAECGMGRSCNLTLGITDYIRASDLFADTSFTDPDRRQKIIKSIAKLLGKMHAAGLAHQDFYLVHLFIKPQENDAVYLIDLQRTIMQTRLADRWRVKDLAQIHFALCPHVNQKEMNAFFDSYSQNTPSTLAFKTWWKAAVKKSKKIEKHTRKRNL